MLTARGMGVAIIVGALFILGAVTHYPEVGVIAAAGLGAVLIGLGWVLRRPHLEVLRTIEPARVERGGLALGLVTVTNPGRFTSSSTMALERFGGQKLPFEVPRLQAGGTKRTTYRLPTERRAVVDVGPVNVVRQDPFGLWRSSQRVGSVERLWVHPRTHLLLGHPLGRTRSLDGPDADNVPQGSITFHSLREYVIGDDMRRVHWRTSARLGTLMVREQVDTSIPQVTVALDTSTTSYNDDAEFEEAVEVAASISVAMNSMSFPVRLLTSGGHGVMARGIGGDTPLLLDQLAEVKVQEEHSFNKLITSLSNERRGDVIAIVTGLPSESDLHAAAALGKRYDAGVIAIIGAKSDNARCVAPESVRVIRGTSAAKFARTWNVAMSK